MIKRWILNLSFVKEAMEAVKENERKTAFTFALDDVKSTIKDDTEGKAQAKAKQLLNDLLAPIDMTEIVTFDKTHGIVYIGGVRAEEGRMANLHAEAEFFLESDLWQLIHETPKELAQKAMFVNGETMDDLKKGRSILYTLSSQRNIVEIFKAYTQKK